jgi:hypothetical protein
MNPRPFLCLAGVRVELTRNPDGLLTVIVDTMGAVGADVRPNGEPILQVLVNDCCIDCTEPGPPQVVGGAR